MHRLALAVALLSGCTDPDDSEDTDPNEVTENGDHGETVAGGLWAADMTVTLGTDTLTLGDDGLPDHDTLEAYLLFDGSTTGVVAGAYTVEVPRNPTMAASTQATNGGTIGVLISGGVLFNPYEGDGTTVALDNNFEQGGVPFLDACSGHPLPTGKTYHYHGVPYCITDVVDPDDAHSVLIGVLLDGFPVYGAQGEEGSAPTDLDACSGHEGPTAEFPAGTYHYHLTETAPYSIACYSGEVEVGGPP